ncbi:MAG: PIG-L family deacetylase [Candidatus Gerdarchaeota archaeon]|nr:MAG: PIG-L family deacetylase [Candidatus Gerdarchaeota archaeon]RLI71461.1 MAG: PIG-L family deacetylase [Candidatus Gerdarchaeota archaeon]
MRIVVLSPHTDDGEFGAGGTIARFVEEKHEVFYIAFSTARKSVKPGFPKDALKTEVKKATKVLGIPPKNLFIHDYEVRSFPANRQEILEDLVNYRKDLAPDIVFLPNSDDMHQDHQIMHNEGIRAFRITSSLLGYEFPRNNIQFSSTCFIKLEERHIAKKIAAIKEYKTQADKFYSSEDYLRALARVRGVQLDHQYAEAFEAIRIIIGKGTTLKP